jgi:cell division protein FtsB
MTLNSQDFMQQVRKHSEFRPTRSIIAVGTLFLFVGIIIGALYLSQSSTTSALGRQLEELVIERNDLEQANEQLRAEIASLRGVGRLLTRAQELGFVPAEQGQIQYLVVSGYNAVDEPLEALAIPEAEPVVIPVYDESFFGWAQQQFDSLRRQIESFTQEAP